MKKTTLRNRLFTLALVVFFAVAAVHLLIDRVDHALAGPDPLSTALEKARAAGSYRYVADSERVVHRPGAAKERQSVHVEGEAVGSNRSRARAWAGGGSLASGEGALDLILIDDRAWVYAEGQWQPTDVGLSGITGPDADTLAYLDVANHPTLLRRERGLDVYGFRVEGEKLARHWRKLVNERMRCELPVDFELRIDPAVHSARGHGELWIDPATGLPVRQTLELTFPNLGDGSSLYQSLDVLYTDFGAEMPPVEPPTAPPASPDVPPTAEDARPPVANTHQPPAQNRRFATGSLWLVAGLMALGWRLGARRRLYGVLACVVVGLLVLLPPLKSVATVQALDTYSVRARDIAGNLGPTNVYQVEVGPDTIGPALSIVSPAADALLNGASIIIQGTASDFSGVEWVQVSTDGGADWFTATGTTNWSYFWTLPSQDGVAHTLIARSQDGLGHSSQTAGQAVIVDTIAPTSSIGNLTTGQEIDGANYLVSGAASDGHSVALVEVSTNGGASWLAASGTTAWTYDWVLPASGTYTVTVRATDGAGNAEVPGEGVVVHVVSGSGEYSVYLPLVLRNW